MKKSELQQIIKEEISKVLNENKYQVVFISYSDEEVPYTEQYFDSYEEANAWVDGYEAYEYEEVWNSASQDYEQEKVFNYYNPQDKQIYSGYDIRQMENLSESQQLQSLEQQAKDFVSKYGKVNVKI